MFVVNATNFEAPPVQFDRTFKNLEDAFYFIRDIPYRYLEGTFEDQINSVIQGRGGSCTPKHYVLGELFKQLGATVEYALINFKWEDLQIDFPENINKIIGDLPEMTHTYLLLVEGDKKHIVDATWDGAIYDLGFPELHWTSEGTSLAVIPHGRDVKIFPFFEDRAKYTREKLQGRPYQKELKQVDFMNTITAWLDDYRAIT